MSASHRHSRMRRHAVTAALGALFVAGCASLLSEPHPYGEVRVRIVTPDGNPIPGITALLYTGLRPMAYDSSDANGRVRFRLVPPDIYGVRITLPPGLMDQVPGATDSFRAGFPVVADSVSEVEFVLRSPGIGALEAEVLDSALQPVEGIRMVVYTFRDVVTTIVSDSLGFARADSLPADYYGVGFNVPDTLGGPSGPFIYRDALQVTEFDTPRARFLIPVCRGDIAVSVRDQANEPVRGIRVTRYDSFGEMGDRRTASNGLATFSGVPCGAQGFRLQPLPGFTISSTEGQGFADGFLLTRGGTLSVTLRATRN